MFSSPFSKSNNSSTFIHSCINISLTHTYYLYNFSKLKTIFQSSCQNKNVFSYDYENVCHYTVLGLFQLTQLFPWNRMKQAEMWLGF